MTLQDQMPLVPVALPGFGTAAQEPALDTIGAMAAWVLSDLSDRGVSRFRLLGHSMGGMIAQEMTHQAPDRIDRLVLYATGALGAMPGRFEPLETSMQRAREEGAAAFARRVSATWFRKGAMDPAYPACARIAEQAELAAVLAGLEAMRRWSGQDRLAGIAAPTLVLWGDQDRSYAWDQIALLWRSIPGSRLAVVPDRAHAVHAEWPAHFNAVIADFLSPE